MSLFVSEIFNSMPVGICYVSLSRGIYQFPVLLFAISGYELTVVSARVSVGD